MKQPYHLHNFVVQTLTAVKAAVVDSEISDKRLGRPGCMLGVCWAYAAGYDFVTTRVKGMGGRILCHLSGIV